jgi:hypothetical protein
VTEKLWSESEDSFLKHFCDIQRNEITDFYVWCAGLNWPKFTFIRLHSLANFTLPKFLSDVEKFKNLSKVGMEDLVVKINDSYLIPDSLKNKLELTKSRLAYLSFK